MVDKKKHKDLTHLQGIHPIQHWVVADDAALAALSVVAGDVGRVARKLDDNTFHILTDDSPVTWLEIGSGGGGGAGDVVGPASATDNAVVRFDTTTGKLVQGSLVTVSDTGSISIPAGQTVDGRDPSVDGTKLDGIEAGADVTDSANVAAAGAVMTSRTVSTTAPLAGGGALSGDLTLSITAASGSNAGSMSAAHWTKLEGIEAAADVTDATNVEAAGAAMLSTGKTIYINGSTGNDANDGSVGSPVATMAGAAARCPDVCSGALIYVFAAAGNYAYTECPTVFTGAGRWSWYALSATRVSSTTGTAGASTDATTIKGTFTTNQYQHHIVEMTSGLGNGYRRTVQQCTTTDLIPVRQFENQAASATVAVASGDTYSVYRPGVVVTSFTGIRNKRVLLWDIAFASVSNQPIVESCDIYGAGVEFRGTVFPHFVNCTGSFGQWDHIDAASNTLLSTTSVHWALPSSPARSAEVAAWFVDFGLANSLTTLAQHRGCGVSCPDVTTTFTTTSGHLQTTQCVMSIHGTMAACNFDKSDIGFGGYFWGTVRANEQSLCVATGRCGVSGSTAEATVTRRRLDATFNSIILMAAPWTSTPSGFASWLLEDNSTLILGANGNVVGGSASNDQPGTIERGSTVRIRGTTTVNANISSSTSFGVPSILNSSRLVVDAATTINNSSSRALLCRSRSSVVLNAALTFVGTGGVWVTDGGLLLGASALTVTNGPLLVENGADVSLSGNVTVSGQAADGVTVNGGTLHHTGGIFSSTATAGKGMVVKGGNVRLRATTNAVLAGSSGNPGLQATAGAQVWFDGAPTSVTSNGSASGALQVNSTVAVSNAVLASAYDSVSDGSTSIGRAA